MVKKVHIILAFTLFFITVGIGCVFFHKKQSDQNMYTNPIYWYDNGKTFNPDLVDVFYVLPTCVFDWTDSNNQVQHYASLTDETQRGMMLPSYRLADEIFADSANFFAPYYRHITMETWMAGENVVAERFPFSMSDVKNAFSYYLEHYNNNRPFVLAGFSQGGKCVVELIKSLDEEIAARMIAAYVCGYRVTNEDTESSPFLRCARKSDDTGVTVAYNTVGNTDGVSPIISEGNKFVINPASWTTDTLPHQLNDSVSIRVDRNKNILIAEGIDPQAVFIPQLESIFPVGNYHLLELTLYHDQLQKNVKQRIREFTK